MSRANLLLKVQPPMRRADGVDEQAMLREGQVLVAPLMPLSSHELVRSLAKSKVTAFSLDMIPRITRAQSMDILSSMATLAGYKAVLLSAAALPRMFPLMMTAAGTLPAARVFVIGAGVAGLQAIATARRLGAVVSAFDTRPVVKEQVQSLGAKFIEIQVGGGEGQGGYARELTPEEQERQRILMGDTVAASDVVITTAAVPGRRAPMLIPEEVVKRMRPGTVIVDLAAETGGNCALTVAGETVVRHGVTIIGPRNLPSTMAFDASQMFSRNVCAFISAVYPKGQATENTDDEVVRGALITRGGEVVHEAVIKALATSAPAAPPPPAPEPAPAQPAPAADPAEHETLAYTAKVKESAPGAASTQAAVPTETLPAMEAGDTPAQPDAGNQVASN
jgi:NAD(P) transhydrogenase subunit alpha